MKWYAFALTLLVLSTGCNSERRADYSQLGLVHPTGLVTLDGQPLPNAVITFEDPQTGAFSYGLTNASGEYSGLRVDSRAAGVIPGEKRVRISTTRRILGLNSEEEGSVDEEPKRGKSPDPDARPSDTGKELVPDKYNQKSELVVTVDEQQLVHNFELVSK